MSRTFRSRSRRWCARASRDRRSAWNGPPGRVFVLRADLISTETRAFLASVARVVSRRTTRRSVRSARSVVPESQKRHARPFPKRACPASQPTAAPSPPDLEFFNGLGGFAEGGQEYVTILGPGQSTPAPWINVIANPAFGFQVATEGGGYHLVRQQPREPAHPLVQRSGHRSSGRGVLSARRRHR